jgi:hypothetical protein
MKELTDSVNKMSCPHCGKNYGFFWVLFPYGHRKGFLSTGKECKGCKKHLGLEEKNAQAAQRIKQIAIIPNLLFWILAGTGLALNSPSEEGFIFPLLFTAFIYSLLCGLSICITLYVVNFVYIRIHKEIGYLSLVPDAQHIFKVPDRGSVNPPPLGGWEGSGSGVK